MSGKLKATLAATIVAAVVLFSATQAQAHPSTTGQSTPSAAATTPTGPVTHRQLCAGPCRSDSPAPPAAAMPGVPPGAAPAAVSPPVGSWGFDMNGNGCNGTSFAGGAAPQGVTNAPNLGFDSVQLNGWGWNDMYGNDPCFQAQVQWYQQNNAGSPIQFIMFPVPYDNNACNSYSTSTSDGHNAGSAQAQQLYQKAVSAGLPVQGGMWWLDIEGAACNSWDPSKSQINLAVIQGAVDYLHGQGLTVGIYTDAGEWNSFTNTNTTQFAGIPAWNAVPYYPGSGGTYVTVHNDSGQNPYNLPTVLSWARQQCGHTGITGGPLWAVQYMWGNYNATYYTTAQPPAILGRDFDYACQGAASGPPSISSLSGSGAMASTVTVNGSNFGAAQGSSYVHLWFTADNPHSCATDSTTISWGQPGNWAAFSIQSWSAGAVSFQVPTPSGPNRQIGSSLGSDLWMIPAGDTGCVAVTTSGGTSATASFTAQAPATSSYASSGWTVGFNGPGVYGFRGTNIGPGSGAPLVCSEPAGQAILDQQGYMYPVWDLVDIGGSFNWVWDGEMATPTGGLSLHCSAFPAANPVPASITAIAALAGFQMGQSQYVFGAGFGGSRGSGYVHLWTNNTAGSSAANCGDGAGASTNWGEPGNGAAFTLNGWADTRVVFQVPTPSGSGQVGSQWQIYPGNWACTTIVNSAGASTQYGQYAIFVEQAPATQSFTTSGAANIRSGPSTADAVLSTASAGQSLTLICYDPNGQSVSGYATWDQLSNGQWVWDGLMNTPSGGPSGLPRCANYPPDL
jgi:hypothetical protein